MAKKTVSKTVALENMTRGEIKVRYDGNIAERNRLAEENKLLRKLWKTAQKGPRKTVKKAN
jgi:hypothetical protein